MEKTTVQTNRRTVLCDLPNTLFDSRHRTIEELGTTYITNIKDDELNYAVYSLLKDFYKLGYKIVYSHYCLQRLRPKIETLMAKHKLSIDELHTNYSTQEVHSNQTLKKYLHRIYDFDIVIDNDSLMRSWWDTVGVSLINVPLSVKYSNELR